VRRRSPAPATGQILDAVSIRQRPAEVHDRAVPGHWEGDLLEGARGTYIATLVERQSRYVMLVRLTSKDTSTVTRAIARRLRRLPHGLMKSLTWDRGVEFAAHRAFTIATNVSVYFCDSRSHSFDWTRPTEAADPEQLAKLQAVFDGHSGYAFLHEGHHLLKGKTCLLQQCWWRTPIDVTGRVKRPRRGISMLIRRPSET
jgi:hypothetical protein